MFAKVKPNSLLCRAVNYITKSFMALVQFLKLDQTLRDNVIKIPKV
jgi:hypothetical protein